MFERFKKIEEVLRDNIREWFEEEATKLCGLLRENGHGQVLPGGGLRVQASIEDVLEHVLDTPKTGYLRSRAHQTDQFMRGKIGLVEFANRELLDTFIHPVQAIRYRMAWNKAIKRAHTLSVLGPIPISPTLREVTRI